MHVHKRKAGCPHCNDKHLLPYTRKDFVKKAIAVHGNKYDYSALNYKNSKTNVTIICKQHGQFKQLPTNHTNKGMGCPTCGRRRSENKHRKSNLEYIKKAKSMFGDKFSYEKCNYTGYKNEVTINCKEHGYFTVVAEYHVAINGGGSCPTCTMANVTSMGELELGKFISSNYNGKIRFNDREILDGLELDLYLPELKLAIEYNGLYWHSVDKVGKKYHYNKYLKCKEKGVRLITIWESEWIRERQKCEDYLLNLVSDNKSVYYARKLELHEPSINEEREFINYNHFQGYVPSTKALCLKDGEEIIMIMTFTKNKDHYEIGRLCTKRGSLVVGGSKKLFKQLVDLIGCIKVISYNNVEKFTGKVYLDLGMKLHGHSIGYFYGKKHETYSRQKFQKKKLVANGYDPSKTERQIMQERGYSRIYPAGNEKYLIEL